jgi:hypothetical protein
MPYQQTKRPADVDEPMCIRSTWDSRCLDTFIRKNATLRRFPVGRISGDASSSSGTKRKAPQAPLSVSSYLSSTTLIGTKKVVEDKEERIPLWDAMIGYVEERQEGQKDRGRRTPWRTEITHRKWTVRI